MKKILTLFAVLLAFSACLSAQEGKNIRTDVISVAMFEANYAFQMPALDTKVSFGVNSTIGGSFGYKTDENWLWTANVNYIFGKKVKGDRIDLLGEGITTVDGELIGGGGSLVTLAVYQRGWHFQAELGKVFPFYGNPNSGILVQAGLGYLLNRIRIEYDKNLYNTPYPVEGDYEYGYDRMRGGPAFHGEVGYLYLGDTRLLNFSIALEVTYARTRPLRDYDFRVFTNPATGQLEPVGRIDPNTRYNDLYYGIRFNWLIPTYQRQPEVFYYD